MWSGVALSIQTSCAATATPQIKKSLIDVVLQDHTCFKLLKSISVFKEPNWLFSPYMHDKEYI